MAGRKQIKTKDLIMMKPGLRAKAPDSPALSLASSSSRRPLNYTNAGYENADTLSTGPDYEELDLYKVATNPRRSANLVYETAPSPIPQHMGMHRKRQLTECSDDSTSTNSTEHQYSNSKRWCKSFFLAFSVITSSCSLVLIILMMRCVVGPKCNSSRSTLVGGGSKSLTVIQSPSLRVQNESHLDIINALKKNISVLREQDDSLKKRLSRQNKTITTLREVLENLIRKYKESQSRKFQNITIEVQALRTKQDNVDTSLEDLRSNDKTTNNQIKELERKAQGLAISVDFLRSNDSLIKSKVGGLLQSNFQTKTELAALKRKDVSLNATIKGLESYDVAVNNSLSGLKMFDEQLKMKLSLVNSTVTSKMQNLTNLVNQLQQTGGKQGPPGPRGPQGPAGPMGPSGVSGKGGSLKNCIHGFKENPAASGSTATATVNYIVDQGKVVTGVTCSTQGGDETNLDRGTNNQGQTVYVCACLGKSTSSLGSSSKSIKCRIDYWVCPNS